MKKPKRQLDPEVQSVFEKAFGFLRDGEYQKAINLCTRPHVQALIKELSVPNFILGKSYFLLGSSKGDIFAGTYFLEKALELGEDHDEVYAMLASLYLRQRKFKQATQAFGHYLSEKISSAQPWLLYSMSALLSDALEESEQAALKASTYAPESWEPQFLLFCIYGKQKNAKKAASAASSLALLTDSSTLERLHIVQKEVANSSSSSRLYELLAEQLVENFSSSADVAAGKESYQAEAMPQALSAEYGIVETAKDFHWITNNIPCQAACPALTDVPGYIGSIAVGDYQKAYHINKQYNVLPGILGRVCSRPCEGACRHGFKGNGDPVSICFLKRVSDDFRPNVKYAKEKLFSPTGKSVAVVGSGPAGLTVANDLCLLGHEVTIYEGYHEPGGMLVQGIPKFRLPREIVQQEVNQILDLGVKIQCGTRIGKDIPLTTLLNDFDAVVLAAGTLKPNKLKLPGEDLDGVLHGLGFMEQVNNTDSATIGNNVVVVGGGFTAMDCARSSFRLGATTVGIYYRRTQNEMPVTKEEIEEAVHEGIPLYELMSPVEFVGNNGKVTGVKFIKNKLGAPDASGRRRPEEIPGSEVIIPADTVLLATGQFPDYEAVEKSFEKDDLFKKGWLTIDKESHMTKIPRLFATGDFVSGASSIIQAVGSARRTANKLDTFLIGRQRRKSVVKIEPATETGRMREFDFIPIQPMPMVPVQQRDTLKVEVETGYKRENAHESAKRCYLCHYKFEIDMRKCIYCDWCIKAKPEHLQCIKKVAEFAEDGQGIVTGVREATNFDETKAIWIDSHECIRCGQCLRACPLDAITIKKVSLDEVTCDSGERGKPFLELK
ncbi:MAG: FAD-dependent oxidoreductase [bacterium]